MLVDRSRNVEAGEAHADAAGVPSSDAATVLDTVAPQIRPIVLPGARVRDKLAAGVPLLHGEELYVDGGVVSATWDRLLTLFGDAEDWQADVPLVRQALASHRLHAEHATVEALVSHPEHVREIALAADAPVGLVEYLSDLAARPVLAAYARQLAPALGLAAWDRGYCPICGVPPVRGEQSEDGVDARLRCDRCDTAWTPTRPATQPEAGFRLELADGEAEWDGFDDD